MGEGRQGGALRTVQRLRAPGAGEREIFLAGGCFWGTEEYLSGIAGVAATAAGYANGRVPAPTYEAVCSHATGYAEAVHAVYRPGNLPLPFLLRLFLRSVDPFSVNRQGADVGDQYRTGCYCTDPADLPVIEAALAEASREGGGRPVAVEAKPLENFWLAEPWHQQYLKKNPGGYCHVPRALMDWARDARDYRVPGAGELAARLTPMQYEVTQRGGTEPPFQNEYHAERGRGVYLDVTTGQPLFSSKDKFDSGCGWPAFSAPIHGEDVVEAPDFSHGMERTEVRSRLGGAHLGHVFGDGPRERGGLRYCINSAALRFVPEAEMEALGLGHLLRLL